MTKRHSILQDQAAKPGADRYDGSQARAGQTGCKTRPARGREKAAIGVGRKPMIIYVRGL